MLKIYGRANSINVRKVLWMCHEIGLEYAREDWGRGFRPTSEPEFQRVSRFGVVPVVDDDGFVLRESNRSGWWSTAGSQLLSTNPSCPPCAPTMSCCPAARAIGRTAAMAPPEVILQGPRTT
jgi:hypothetical protein